MNNGNGVCERKRGISRRALLTGIGAAGAMVATPRWTLGYDDCPGDQPEFTFVHLTDMHVTPRRKGNLGYQRCVETVLAESSKPAFALMGGDLAFDGLYTPKADFEEQIRLYREITSGLKLPIHHCMGNHDALGLSPRRKVGVDDPDFGKRMIMDRLSWDKSYYSFDHKNWHFAVLDSIFPIKTDSGPTYEPRIGPEQLEWLAYDLGSAAARGKNSVVVTHIAAFCNLGQQNGDPKRKAMDGGMVLWDTKELREVLTRHNVKALLQGHSHRIEETFFDGVWYITSAAVSGAWWSGDWIGCGPGYTVFSCHREHLAWEHRPIDWQPRLEPEDDLERQKLAERKAFLESQEQKAKRERQGAALQSETRP